MDEVKCQHCFVWGGNPYAGVLVIHCAHCGWPKPSPRGRVKIGRTTDPEEFARKIGQSQAGHDRVCQR